jgi:DnaJ family protein A protein 2
MGGLITQETSVCSSCKGSGNVFKDKDRCKKCKGEMVVEVKKVLELYIPRGAGYSDSSKIRENAKSSRQNERIVLAGEADQVPDQEPGDLVFVIDEVVHETFTRAGPDLVATVDVTLAEALCGFSRVVVKHLDGRGIHITHPQGEVLEPDQCLVIKGEGMPLKKSDSRGNLYLRVNIIFPENGWVEKAEQYNQLQSILPKAGEPVNSDSIDEVEYDADGELEQVSTNL